MTPSTPPSDPRLDSPTSPPPVLAELPAAFASLGLRERKKIQTRAAIQRHALRLFHVQGYSATTMDQIAAAADVSPSTLYRYFPTKEDLVLVDDYDPLLAAAFRSQPAHLGPLEAMRGASMELIAGITGDERAAFEYRFQLTFTVPEVRAKALNHLLESTQMLATLFAERTPHTPDAFPIQVLAGSVVGAILAAQTRWVSDPTQDMAAIMAEALDLLIAGPAALTPQPHA